MNANWSGGGIWLQDNSDALISHCTISNNRCEGLGAGICSAASSPTVKNCIITCNDGGFSGAASSYDGSYVTFINCTIADNFSTDPAIGTGGLYCWDGDANITNTILWNNYGYSNSQIEYYYGDEIVEVAFSDVQMPGSGDIWEGVGNINDDPLFADPDNKDYHLKSAAGRWTVLFETNGDFDDDGIVNFVDFALFANSWRKTSPTIPANLNHIPPVDLKDLAVFASNWLAPGQNSDGWVSDDVTSPCIGAGDPSFDYSLEPAPNGGTINMGAYGNTEEASKSPQIAN